MNLASEVRLDQTFGLGPSQVVVYAAFAIVGHWAIAKRTILGLALHPGRDGSHESSTNNALAVL